MQEVQQEIVDALHGFGLNESEIAVYQAALQLGTRPASTIAQRAGLKRGHTYNVLNQLAQKGIVQELVKNSVRHFTCGSPESLLSVLENREQEITRQKQRIKDVIPKLEQLRNPIHSTPQVRFFQGEDGVREIFEDTLRYENLRTIYGLLDFNFTCTTMGIDIDDWMEDYVQRRSDRGIVYKGIFVKSAIADRAILKRKSDERELKVIQGIELPVEIFVYGSRTAIISTHDETLGFIVENARIAETLVALHQHVWKFLPDYEI